MPERLTGFTTRRCVSPLYLHLSCIQTTEVHVCLQLRYVVHSAAFMTRKRPFAYHMEIQLRFNFNLCPAELPSTWLSNVGLGNSIIIGLAACVPVQSVQADSQDCMHGLRGSDRDGICYLHHGQASRYLAARLFHKDKGLDTCYSAGYMSQTRDQQRFTISEVGADWHEPMVPKRIMWPSTAGQLDPRCS